MKRKVIEEEDNKIDAQLPSLLFEEEVVKKVAIEEEKDEIEVGF